MTLKNFLKISGLSIHFDVVAPIEENAIHSFIQYLLSTYHACTMGTYS